jgi:Uri superfamily endonuclease
LSAGTALSPRLYIVLTRVPRRTDVAVGSLGPVTFERGWYAYVGSAARAREARVARHLAREKPLRWHADYLFAAFPAERAWLVDGAAGECELAGALAALPGAERRPRRFGAGDCRCSGHLVRFGRRPLRRDLAAAAHAAGAPLRGAVRAFGSRPASA